MKKFFLSLMIIGIFAFFNVKGEALPKKGLVLHLSFDEIKGDKVNDFSGQGNDGTIHGGAKVVSGALELDEIEGGRCRLKILPFPGVLSTVT